MRLPVFILFREYPGRNWRVIAFAPYETLVAMCEPGDEIHPAGSAPPGFRDR